MGENANLLNGPFAPQLQALKLSTCLLLIHIIGHGGEGRRWHGSVLVQIEGQLRKEQQKLRN